jgi:hypothetical protein
VDVDRKSKRREILRGRREERDRSTPAVPPSAVTLDSFPECCKRQASECAEEEPSSPPLSSTSPVLTQQEHLDTRGLLHPTASALKLPSPLSPAHTALPHPLPTPRQRPTLLCFLQLDDGHGGSERGSGERAGGITRYVRGVSCLRSSK